MSNDERTPMQILKDMARIFRDERDWEQFHDPKNLAEAISIEAGELQELFLWKDKEAVINEIKNDLAFRESVGEEFADIMIYCLHFANATGFDIATAVKDKIEKSKKKYPIEKARGNAKKYTEL